MGQNWLEKTPLSITKELGGGETARVSLHYHVESDLLCSHESSRIDKEEMAKARAERRHNREAARNAPPMSVRCAAVGPLSPYSPSKKAELTEARSPPSGRQGPEKVETASKIGQQHRRRPLTSLNRSPMLAVEALRAQLGIFTAGIETLKQQKGKLERELQASEKRADREYDIRTELQIKLKESEARVKTEYDLRMKYWRALTDALRENDAMREEGGLCGYSQAPDLCTALSP